MISICWINENLDWPLSSVRKRTFFSDSQVFGPIIIFKCSNDQHIYLFDKNLVKNGCLDSNLERILDILVFEKMNHSFSYVKQTEKSQNDLCKIRHSIKNKQLGHSKWQQFWIDERLTGEDWTFTYKVKEIFFSQWKSATISKQINVPLSTRYPFDRNELGYCY